MLMQVTNSIRVYCVGAAISPTLYIIQLTFPLNLPYNHKFSAQSSVSKTLESHRRLCRGGGHLQRNKAGMGSSLARHFTFGQAKKFWHLVLTDMSLISTKESKVANNKIR